MTFMGVGVHMQGHNSPLYQSPQGDPDGSVQTGINYLTSSGIPLQKINLGIPFGVNNIILQQLMEVFLERLLIYITKI